MHPSVTLRCQSDEQWQIVLNINLHRFKRRTRLALREKPDGTDDQILVLRRNEYHHCSSYQLHALNQAFLSKPPTYEVFGLLV